MMVTHRQQYVSHFINGRLGQRLKAPARAALRASGYDLVPIERNVSQRLQELLSTSGVNHLIDVGANIGQYAETMRYLGFDQIIDSFEPGLGAFSVLEQRAASDELWNTHKLALGDQPGLFELYVSQNSTSSSLLPMEPAHLLAAPASRMQQTELVDVRLLDDLALGPCDGRVWLKLDTQGFEMAVLRGAEGTLQRTEVLQVELSLTELYQGQPNYLELLSMVEHLGFAVFDILPGFRAPLNGRLLQMDAILVRD